MKKILEKIKKKISDFISDNIGLLGLLIIVLIAAFFIWLDYTVATADIPEWIKWMWFSRKK